MLIPWGDRDSITDIGGVEFPEERLKSFRTVILKETGHAPMEERPEETAKASPDFLKEKR